MMAIGLSIKIRSSLSSIRIKFLSAHFTYTNLVFDSFIDDIIHSGTKGVTYTYAEGRKCIILVKVIGFWDTIRN